LGGKSVIRLYVSGTLVMKDANVNQTKPIPFVLFIAIAVMCYGVIWLLDWPQNHSFDSLVALKESDISEIMVFNNASSQKSLLLTLDNPRDIETIQGFVNAVNDSTQSSARHDVIPSHELYLVINLDDSDNTIELLFHLQSNCGKTVYIDIVKKPGGVESKTTTYFGSAKSEKYLYEWLQDLNLINYLGC
jgi:hypothetical protein